MLGPDLIDLRTVEIAAEKTALGLVDAHEAGAREAGQDRRAAARAGSRPSAAPAAAPAAAAPKAMSKIDMIRAKREAKPSRGGRRPPRPKRPPQPSPRRPPSPRAARSSSGPRPGRPWSGSATPGSPSWPAASTPRSAQGTVSIVQAALLVPTDKLVDVALFLRDKNPIKYDYLASLQSVHFEDCIEVNYQLDSTDKPGTLIELRVRTAEAEGAGRSPVALPRLPRGRLPGARGLRHDGRPLHGPPRADAHPHVGRLSPTIPCARTFSSRTTKDPPRSFASRVDEGHGQHFRAEEINPYGTNMKVPKTTRTGPASRAATIPRERGSCRAGSRSRSSDTDQFVVSMGPQHPSTHGVFRLNLRLDGETIVGLKPVMGYMHRNHEKIGERNTFLMNFPFTDRLDYLTSMGNNFGYALAVEQLMGDDAKPPERAEYIRVIMAELTRIASHMWSIGFLLNDLGAFFTPALYAIEERELILDLFEWAAGSRMMCNYFRFGGVAFDLPPGWIERCRGIVNDRIDKKIDELDRYLSQNEIVLDRTKGVGVLTREQAINYSTAGPVLRASSVNYDIRRAAPYSIYDRFDFKVITGSNGDLYDRYYVRLQEMRESADLEAGGSRHSRRAHHPGQEELPDQGARRRSVFAGREPQGRAGLLRLRRRVADGLSLPRAQPELHQPDRARGDVPGPHDRRRRRHSGKPGHRPGRGRPLRIRDCV